MSTIYHAKYYAHELTRQSSQSGVEKLSRSLFDASVDLNPHQIEAALFAFRSPLSKGVVLADEVGLGKTIEAGLVLCQKWAEGKRKLLIICPASLRKQWSTELKEKFNLSSVILEAKSFNEFIRQGKSNPFLQDVVIITSFQFANHKRNELRLVPWDTAVIDEAHKLRNVYRKSNKMGKGIKWALEDRKKLLLTATPLQNSLLELFGLSLLIDDHIFGDISAFRSQYMNNKVELLDLKERLKTFVHRTLRSQVLEYIRYTERVPITFPFKPSDNEQALYQSISDFLLKEDTYAIPNRQKVLTILIIRKLLASSSQALAGTLQTIKERLEALLEDKELSNDWLEQIIDYDEMEHELIDEVEMEDEEEQDYSPNESLNIEKLKEEISEVSRLLSWAKSIRIDSKSRALVKALKSGFNEMGKMGASRKALIFTESRRTQEYLKDFLEANGYTGKIVLFNGTNNDEQSKNIYNRWVEKYHNTSKISGSKTSDKRAALVEYFRDDAEIMIATESAAEGVNLQFCSLVINYDLPWNPQRIEQRIGRCHRYGQQHDVVVINFLNERNEADRRVYELLKEKFNLFTGVLGASDEVLGSIESGVDFEKRILSIYQRCRTTEEIELAFKQLQGELEEQIQNRMNDTRQALLEHFDAEVHSRFKVHLEDTKHQLDRVSKMFWSLTRVILNDNAQFNDDDLSFNLIKELPMLDVKKGQYELISKDKKETNANLYRLSHPLGEYVINSGKSIITPVSEVQFDITNHPVRISLIESLKGKGGYLTLTKLIIDSYEKEEYLLFNGITDDNKLLDQEICEKLFQCKGYEIRETLWSNEKEQLLNKDANRHVQATISQSLENNNMFFHEERERLERWADDLILASEKELNDTKARIKEAKRQARLAASTEEQHQIQKEIKTLERQQRKQRQRIFEVEDEIMDKRDDLIDELEKKMVQKTVQEELFTVRWKVI
ncbi:SNF2-related protein [Bacillus sp. (in: firmicutes)]|uniref:SNF2-related protein n=1 Tax=Bacillus sp. TaxID=1409 RepID=UPI000ED08FC1|nr:SNF2-related protein [Bacillus sp. (in: firmicutes)]HCO79990.1 ATP-dependent helicase [Bacillus sp. (in: firmicutes)]